MIDLQLREAAALCLSALQRYHDGERTEAARARMRGQIELVIRWLMGLDLPAGVTEERILRPVEAALLEFYGHEVGGRLGSEYVEVFEDSGMPLISRAKPG